VCAVRVERVGPGRPVTDVRDVALTPGPGGDSGRGGDAQEEAAT
jgi:hypothetical protein